jgi:hypothetical protein
VDREKPLRANLPGRMRTHPSLTPLQDHFIPENIKKVFDSGSRIVVRKDAPKTRIHATRIVSALAAFSFI